MTSVEMHGGAERWEPDGVARAAERRWPKRDVKHLGGVAGVPRRAEIEACADKPHTGMNACGTRLP
jgi:hypothetical protein